MGGTPPYEYNIDGGIEISFLGMYYRSNTCPLGKVFTGLNPGSYYRHI